MTDPIIEAARLALYDTDGWDQDDEQKVHAVLAAVTPLIRTQVLEEYAVVLKEAELQIKYLHDKFGKTGSGEAVLARIRALAMEEAAQVADSRGDALSPGTAERITAKEIAAAIRDLKEQP